MAERNPPWERDELILALDLYFQHKPSTISQTHSTVIELSNILKQLHIDRPDKVRFRNPNGVYMKLGNFLAAGPNYHGKGLQRGGKLEKQIWEEFHIDPLELHRLANAIKAGYQSTAARPAAADEPDEDDFPEGKLIYRMHRTRERNPALVRLVKARALVVA